jgi:glycine/D-amino acid oxidase-like deaminating enzyme/CRP-like cAMP-binding protein
MPSAGQSRARSRSQIPKLLSIIGVQDRKAKPVTIEQVQRLRAALIGSVEPKGRVSRQIAAELQRIEKEYRFTSSAKAEFQTLLGALGLDSAFPIQVPTNSEPYWLGLEHPLRNYRSSNQLPSESDIVIIGAGLTGASAAYHLRDAAAQGRRVVVLERGFPACEASGRNAGNFELLPENSVGTYEGFARERLHFLRRCYPDIPREVLRVEAERQASLVLSFAVRNRERLKQIIEQEKIGCDFSPKGWLYLAHTEREEQAICDEVAMAGREDQQVEVWSRMKVRQEFGLENGFIGRFVPGDGTYHPAKFVYGTLQIAVTAGVELYTGVAVRTITSSSNGGTLVETSEGTVLAKAVIVATNAFTRELFPELASITPAQSQISVTELAPDRCRGRVVTSEDGPVYFNQPRAAARDGVAPLLLGGGKDRPTKNPSSRRRSPSVHLQLLELRNRYFPELRQRPFSTEWVGPIAFTPDQIPVMGFLKPGIIVAAGFNGYGGSYCVAAGQAAADMAVSGTVPDWLPEDVFSPQRLLDEKPLFFSEISSLWCYAASLSMQLRATRRQLIDALEYSSRSLRRSPADLSIHSLNVETTGQENEKITAVMLRGFKPFSSLSHEECGEILDLAELRTAGSGEILLNQTGPANSCFVVLHGVIDTVHAENESRHVARLGSGGIFGQLALLDGGRVDGTYVARTRTTVLEIRHDACHDLLATRSPLARKFLAVLSEGIIDSLRDAERQLKALNRGPRVRRIAASQALG